MKTLYIFVLLIACTITARADYWKEVTAIPNPYINNYWLDVYFLPSNPNLGWVCGFNGMVIRTTDRGASWRGTIVPNADHLEHIHFPSASTGYTSGPDGIYKSTDGGASWTEVTPFPSLATFWGCHFVDDNNGIVVGGGCVFKQLFWKTTDGGTSWTSFEGNEPLSGLTDVLLYDKNGLGYAVSSGVLWQTTDGGVTWQVKSYSGSKVWQEELTHNGNSFLFPYAGTDCSGNSRYNGGARFTTNGGSSWNDYNTGIAMFGSYLINNVKGWACGDNKTVIYTSDGGLNWVKRNCGLNDGNYDDMWFINENEGWVVGEGVYHLARPEYDLSKDSIIIMNVCVGEKGRDTIWISNFDFEQSSVRIEFNPPSSNVRLFNTANNFSINSCGMQYIIVEYDATDNRTINSSFTVYINEGTPNQKIYTVYLKIQTLISTLIPEKSQLEYRIPVGVPFKGTLKWSSQSGEESITGTEYVQENYDFKVTTKFPIRAFKTGIDTEFEIMLKDTGWSETKIRYFSDRCNFDTVITIRAYGISPIIESRKATDLSIYCDDQRIDTIKISNNGNDTLLISKAEILPLQTKITFLSFDNGQKPPIKVSPKKSINAIVMFKPDTTGTYSAVLSLTNNDGTLRNGAKNPWNINISADFERPLVSSVKVIDFGDVCINNVKSLPIDFINSGNSDGTLYIKKPAVQPFYFDYNNSNPSIIKLQNKLSSFVSFKPIKTGNYNDSLIFYVSPCNDIVLVVLKGRAVSNDLVVIPNAIDTLLRTGDILIKDAKIKSNSDIDVTINKLYLENSNPDWTFSHNLKLPMVLLSGQETNFEIEFKSLKESSYNTKLIVETKSICDETYFIEIDLKSFSRFVAINPEITDFGSTKCTPQIKYQNVIVTNKGFGEDTIVGINLNNIKFKIDNMPKLPYIMQSQEQIELKVGYHPDGEGIDTGILTVNTAEPNGQTLIVELKGEYFKSSTVADKKNLDFGFVEFCMSDKSDKITFTNTGKLNDTLDIIKENLPEGFTFLPDDKLMVDAESSIELNIDLLINKLIPGTNKGKIRFISRVCGDIIEVDLTASLVKPAIVISPNPLDFENVWMDDNKTLNLELTNNSNIDILITKIDYVSDEFSILDELPILLKANSISTLKVQFTAKSIGNKIVPLLMKYESACKDSSSVTLMAVVPEENYNINIKIDRHVVTAGEEITIPVVLVKELEKIQPDSIHFNIRFDNRLFYPLELFALNGQTFSKIDFKYKFGNLDFTVKAPISNKLLEKPGDIILIKGLTFASLPDSTVLDINEIDLYVNKDVAITKENGLLKLTEFCKATANFGLKFIPTFNAKIPQISEGNMINIEMNSSEPLKIDISITDLLSNHKTINDLSVKGQQNTYNIDVSSLSAGVYFVTLKSDYQSKTYKIIIMK